MTSRPANTASKIFNINGVEYTLDRDPRESDAEYEWRKKLFEDLQKSGGRIVIDVKDLTNYEIEQIKKQKESPF